MLVQNVKYLCYALLFIGVISCSKDDDSTPDISGGDEPTTPTPPDTDTEGCESGKTAVFVEKDGALVVEIENGSFADSSWELANSISDFSDKGYLVWNGNDAFNQPGNGTLTYKIRITKTGTYRFIWRSYITIGTNGTEHNDSWLRIADAKHFYGKRGNGNIVYPNDTMQDPIPDSAGQTTTKPNGSSKEGWFKIYMNRANEWHWQSSTSDNDAHDIFVVFDTPGDYTVEISGRSKGHGIDKFVLFTDGVTEDEITKDDAPKSEIKCE